jgi:5,6,7,8-tetrahydromethanopterin hydro-lyase
MSIFVGEALVGDGNEVAHIDLLIGDKAGPVGTAFANALARQSAGHSNLLAVLEPNLAVKPATVMISKVTIKGAGQAVQMFGPAQKGVAKAVADCLAAGTIPAEQAEDLVIVCGVFIHWLAEDNAKIESYNYEATKLSIERAMAGEPSAAEVVAKKDSANHPFQASNLDGGGDDDGDCAGDDAGDDAGDCAGDDAGDCAGDDAGDCAGDDAGVDAGDDGGEQGGDDGGEQARE